MRSFEQRFGNQLRDWPALSEIESLGAGSLALIDDREYRRQSDGTWTNSFRTGLSCADIARLLSESHSHVIEPI